MMTPQELYLKTMKLFTPNEMYKLDFCVPQGFNKEGIMFKFVGTVGEGKLFQFKAVPGGWTVSLSPIQLVGVRSKR